MRRKKGLFVSFEGTEGAGKSTLIHLVGRHLKERGNSVTLTREPGGSPVAEQIRELILKRKMDPWAELFLYEASRAEHLACTIRPALARGEIVLCDRFTDSSLAYQAHARGLNWNQVRKMNEVATQGLEPDLTVFLDVNPAVALRRARQRNRFEAEGVSFQNKVRQGFLKSRKANPRRWLTLNAETSSPSFLAGKTLEELTRRFQLERGVSRRAFG